MRDAARVVLVGLARLGALGARQADVGVGRRDLQDPGLVEDRQRDRGRAGVVLAEIGDRGWVLRRRRALAGDARRAPTCRRRVASFSETRRTGAPARTGLLERELLAAHDVRATAASSRRQRQARVDRQVGRRRGRGQREQGGDQQREGAAQAQNVYRFFGQPSFGLPIRRCTGSSSRSGSARPTRSGSARSAEARKRPLMILPCFFPLALARTGLVLARAASGAFFLPPCRRRTASAR